MPAIPQGLSVAAVCLTPMPHVLDPNCPPVFINRVKDPVVADPDPEDARHADDRLQARWPGILGELVHHGGHPLLAYFVKAGEVPAGLTAPCDLVAHGGGLQPRFGLDLLPWNTRATHRARLQDGSTVGEILQELGCILVPCLQCKGSCFLEFVRRQPLQRNCKISGHNPGNPLAMLGEVDDPTTRSFMRCGTDAWCILKGQMAHIIQSMQTLQSLASCSYGTAGHRSWSAGATKRCGVGSRRADPDRARALGLISCRPLPAHVLVFGRARLPGGSAGATAPQHDIGHCRAAVRLVLQPAQSASGASLGPRDRDNGRERSILSRMFNVLYSISSFATLRRAHALGRLLRR